MRWFLSETVREEDLPWTSFYLLLRKHKTPKQGQHGG